MQYFCLLCLLRFKPCSEVERALCKNLIPNSQFLLHSLYICACRGIWGKACVGSQKSFCQDDAEPNSQQEAATSHLFILMQNFAHTLRRSSPFSKCLSAANSYAKVLLIPQLWAKASERIHLHLAFAVVAFSCCKCVSNNYPVQPQPSCVTAFFLPLNISLECFLTGVIPWIFPALILFSCSSS